MLDRKAKRVDWLCNQAYKLAKINYRKERQRDYVERPRME